MHKKTPFIWDQNQIIFQSSIPWNKNCIVLPMKNINLSWENILLILPQKARRKMEKILLMAQKTLPLFFFFKQAKRRDEILQLLRKQREERISVRLIVRHLDKSVWLGGVVINYGKFSEIDPLNLDTHSPAPFIYYRVAGYRLQIIWQSLINQRYLQSVPALLQRNEALLSVSFLSYSIKL